MSATDIYKTYLSAIVGQAIVHDDDAPNLIAHRLGELARVRGEGPADRLTIETRVAVLDGTARGHDADAAASWIEANPMPKNPGAWELKHWLAAAVQALGAAPEVKS